MFKSPTIKFLSQVLMVGLAAFGATAALAKEPAPTNGAIRSKSVLTCTNVVSGATWQIRINYVEKTVDSNPAQISGTQISWHDRADNGGYTLDRKSGALTEIFASSTGGYFIHARCNTQN